MNKEQAVEFVVRELGRSNSRNEITRQLCEETGMGWPQAAEFIQHVEAKYAQEITLKKSPIVVLLGGTIFIAGIILSGMIVFFTLNGYIIFFLSLPIPYLGNLVYFVLGIAMMIGGMRGVSDIFKKLWAN